MLHVPFPEPREFAAMNVDLTEIEPVERRVDTLLRAETDEGTYLLVVGSQGKKDKKDEDKRRSWPYYLSYLYAKYHCDPVLIVITQNGATARWAAEPIHLGVRGRPSLTVRPLVLGPDDVPVIVDEQAAQRDVTLAVLSAMTHGKGPWRDLMADTQYFWRHPLAEQTREEGREQGRMEARAEMILEILELRGIQVPDMVRERVTACADRAQLTVWAERALCATHAEDLFRATGT